jgi:hypothetical protein
MEARTQRSGGRAEAAIQREHVARQLTGGTAGVCTSTGARAAGLLRWAERGLDAEGTSAAAAAAAADGVDLVDVAPRKVRAHACTVLTPPIHRPSRAPQPAALFVRAFASSAVNSSRLGDDLSRDTGVHDPYRTYRSPSHGVDVC